MQISSPPPSHRPLCAYDAVVLAAGNGSRLGSDPSRPKPLHIVAGRPLLGHVFDALRHVRCRRVHVVVGYGAEVIRNSRELELDGLDVNWIGNPRFHEGNALSLLAARDAVSGPFLLLMADHLFAAETLARLVSDEAPSGGGRLAVDRKLREVFDPEDATRVEETGGRVQAMAKGLARFNAVDTGLLLLTPLAFEAVAACVRAGDDSLAGGMQALARQSSLEAWDIGPQRWVDVDTPAAAAAAERLAGLGLVGVARDAGATRQACA